MAVSIGVSDKLVDALDGMTARDLEHLRELIDRRLVACVLCGADGATHYRVSHKGAVASMAFCPACFEKYRLPDTREEK